MAAAGAGMCGAQVAAGTVEYFMAVAGVALVYVVPRQLQACSINQSINQTTLLANKHLHFINGTHNKNQAIPQQAFLDYFDQLLVYHMYIYIFLEYTK